RSQSSRNDKHTACTLGLLAALLLVILARSSADYAGVRHAMTVCLTMAVMAGFGVSFLTGIRPRYVGLAGLGALFASCVPALAVERPWEYHNFLGGGTKNAYRYFRNDGVDLGQRDKEFADYCRKNLEPRGETPWVSYTPSFVEPDLISYRHLKVRALDDPYGHEFPPATVSGTLLIHGSHTAPAIWSDNKSLREAQPVDRIG